MCLWKEVFSELCFKGITFAVISTTGEKFFELLIVSVCRMYNMSYTSEMKILDYHEYAYAC